jgi:uncharacterized protein YaiI (UPF0178 family)
VTVWVDADGCPAAIRRIVERAAARVNVEVVFAAAKPIAVDRMPRVRFEQVPPGEGSADGYLRRSARRGDLAVTADIPLAAALAAAGVDVIHPRGDVYTADTIGERLAMRNLLTDLRRGGIETGRRRFRGGSHRFAAALDGELARRLRGL